MYQKNLNDANNTNGNWNKSTREKDWMLILADWGIIKINSKLLLFSDHRTNKYLLELFGDISKDNQKEKRITNLETIQNKSQSRTSYIDKKNTLLPEKCAIDN